MLLTVARVRNKFMWVCESSSESEECTPFVILRQFAVGRAGVWWGLMSACIGCG